MANDRPSSTRPLDASAVADNLHSATIHLLRRLRREDAASGIGPARLSALSVLVFGGPTSLGRLAAAEQVKPPTMSRIVAGLARARLVEREGDTRDGRQKVVKATRAGVRVLQAGRRRRIDALARRLRPLTPEQLGTLAAAAALIERIAGRDGMIGPASRPEEAHD